MFNKAISYRIVSYLFKICLTFQSSTWRYIERKSCANAKSLNRQPLYSIFCLEVKYLKIHIYLKYPQQHGICGSFFLSNLQGDAFLCLNLHSASIKIFIIYSSSFIIYLSFICYLFYRRYLITICRCFRMNNEF